MCFPLRCWYHVFVLANQKNQKNQASHAFQPGEGTPETCRASGNLVRSFGDSSRKWINMGFQAMLSIRHIWYHGLNYCYCCYAFLLYVLLLLLWLYIVITIIIILLLLSLLLYCCYITVLRSFQFNGCMLDISGWNMIKDQDTIATSRYMMVWGDCSKVVQNFRWAKC